MSTTHDLEADHFRPIVERKIGAAGASKLTGHWASKLTKLYAGGWPAAPGSPARLPEDNDSLSVVHSSLPPRPPTRRPRIRSLPAVVMDCVQASRPARPGVVLVLSAGAERGPGTA